VVAPKGYTRIKQRDKQMKKAAKKHITLKKKALAKYSKEFEQYIHARRD
jgi:ribulose kinase